MNTIPYYAIIIVALLGYSNLEATADALYEACKQGDIEHVLPRLQDSGKLVAKYGKNPLHLAAEHNQFELAQVLVTEYNLDVNSTTSDEIGNLTPLIYACINNNAPLVEFLIHTASADIDLPNEGGATPLYFAASDGLIESANILLKAGADPNRTCSNGMTPLYTASSYGHTNVVLRLIAAGANVNKATHVGATPLFIACQQGYAAVVRILLKADANLKSQVNGATSLYIASRRGHLDVVRILLEAGSEIDKAMNDGTTPLFIASQERHNDVVRLLIQSGASANIPHNDGSTPLHAASQNGHLDVVRTLLEGKVEIDKRKNTGETPLLMAAFSANIHVIYALLQAGASVNIDNNTGTTPLHFAAHTGRIDIVHALIKAGANVNKPAHDESTPLLLASQQGHSDTVIALIRAGADVNYAMLNSRTSLSTACAFGHPNVAKILIYHGAHIDLQLRIAQSLFEVAVHLPRQYSEDRKLDTMSLAQLLIKKGATVTLEDLRAARRNGLLLWIVAGITDFLKKNPQELPKYKMVMQEIVHDHAENDTWPDPTMQKICALLCTLLFANINAPQQFMDLGMQELKRIQSIHEAFLRANVLEKGLTDLLLIEFLGIPHASKLRNPNQEEHAQTQKQ